jgi:hypothetical protein
LLLNSTGIVVDEVQKLIFGGSYLGGDYTSFRKLFNLHYDYADDLSDIFDTPMF